MLYQIFAASSLLVASALANAEPAPYKLEKLGSMSYNNAFGLAKRQAGYEPSQTYCGPGTDCASSCGAGYIQCASSDSDLHCFNPTIKQSCCPDGSGNSCDAGYFCTSDSTGGTWCCPDGLSLAACAAAYSLTGSLVSQTAAPTVVVPSSTPVSVAAPTTTSASVSTSAAVGPSTSTANSPVTSLTTTSAYSVTTTAVKATTTSSFSVAGNSTSTTSSTPLQVTGAAVRVVYAAPALALAAAGAFLAL